jgi:thymidine phosphorylase
MNTANIDPKKCWRQKVTAEMTTTHLQQIAREVGASLEGAAAVQFLNQHGRAYEMWTVMMRAGEEYIKTKLRESYAHPDHARAWAAAHSR